MGAETIETITLPMDADSAKALVLNAIGDMQKYRLVDDDEALGLVRWRKGFGWTNPVTIEARFKPGGGGTEVELKAMVMALFDPFGFTKEAMEIATGQIRAHMDARSSGGPIPEPPAERRGMYINAVVILVLFLAMFCMCCGGLIAGGG